MHTNNAAVCDSAVDLSMVGFHTEGSLGATDLSDLSMVKGLSVSCGDEMRGYGDETRAYR